MVETAPPELRTLVEAEQWRDRLAKADRGISRAIRSVKPDLDLVMVRNDVTEDVLPPGAIQGRWHVRDKAAKPLPVFMPITDAGGNYREPDSGIITELWKMDLRKKDVVAAVFSRTERQQAQKRKEIDLKREQERDVLREDLRAGWRTKGRIYRDDGSFVKRKVA